MPAFWSRALAAFGLASAVIIACAQDIRVETVKPKGGGFYAWGISGDGKVLFGSGALPNQGSGPMAWSEKDGFNLICNGLGEVVSSSLDGSTLAGVLYGSGDADSGFVWQKDSGLEILTPPASYPGANIVPKAVSGNGKVVVGLIAAADYSSVSPFVWSEGTGLQVLDFSGGAYSVTDDGSEVVGAANSNASYSQNPFIWTAQTGAQLLPYPGSTALASLVSGDGQNLYICVDAGYPDCDLYSWNPINGYIPFAPVWQEVPTSANSGGTIFASPFTVWTKYGPLDFAWYMESRGEQVAPLAQFAGVARDGIHFGASDSSSSTGYLVTIKHIHPMVRSTFYYMDRGNTISLQAPYGFTEGSAAGVDPKLEIVKAPEHAQAFKASVDGTLTYTPDPAFSGIDGFKYRLIAPDREKSNVGEILFYVQPNLKSISLSNPLIDNRAGEPKEVATITFDGPLGTRQGLTCYGSMLKADFRSIPMNFDHAVSELKIPLEHGDPATPITETLTVGYRSQTLTTPVTIDPPTITALWVSGLDSGSPVGHVRISNNELNQQVTVNLSSNSSAATVPSNVVTAYGSTVATFPIKLSPISAPTSVTITATAGNGSSAYTFELDPS